MAILFSFPLAGRSYIELPKTNCISISVFGFEDKEKYPIYMSKKYFEDKHDDFLWKRKEGERHHVLIKDFNTFMYDHCERMEENTFWRKLHCGRKHFFVNV